MSIHQSAKRILTLVGTLAVLLSLPFVWIVRANHSGEIQPHVNILRVKAVPLETSVSIQQQIERNRPKFILSAKVETLP